MGIATDNKPAEYGGMSPYSRWEIDVRMFDVAMKEIDSFTSRQDLWIGEGQFVVRLTRQVGNGPSVFEDRGAVDAHGRIKGSTGFGGGLTGTMFPNNSVFLEGKGGSVDFVLVATQTGSDHYRCFRRFEAHEPVELWGTQVPAGTYYITTEDQIVEQADQPPEDVRRPLGSQLAVSA